MKSIALLVGSLAVLSSSSVHAQAPVIQISGANFRPLPLAAPEPTTLDSEVKRHSSEFDDAFSFDLAAAGIFQVLDRKSFLADAKEGLAAGTINFSRWGDVGAEALVKTQLSTAEGGIRAELRLFNVANGREDFRVSQTMPVSDVRRLAHFLIDAVYRHYTREPGPFQSSITYVRKVGANKEVWLSDWDGKNAKAVSTVGLNVLPTVTPEGQGVAYTSYRRGRPDIIIQKPGGSPTQLEHQGQMATGIAFSPDGKRIAFALAAGEGTQIWVAREDGGGARPITNTPNFINSSPTWSPDGRRIAFVSNRGGSPQIYAMNVDGSGVRRLTFQGNYNQTPDWSPRGDLIVFTARDERNAFDLFTVQVDTGKIARLTQDQGNNEEPSFAPNGRLVIFSSTRKGGARLFVSTTDGQNQQELPLDKAGVYQTPDWGPSVAQ